MPLSRRKWIASVAAVPLLGRAFAPLKVVVTGGHPGDPECGCGGTIARYTDAGHDVVLLYLNRGEGFCGGAPLNRCADIRTEEAQAACRILNANAAFAGQVDGRAVVDEDHYDTFSRILAGERPDVVFTHWPMDRHRDHRAISLLVEDAWWKAGRKFALYYYEVAEDTSSFMPTEYVDITKVEAKRKAACYAHVSQDPGKWYPKQVEITKRRGAAAGVAQAEGFLLHKDGLKGPSVLPGK